ncbi:catechol-2,3-dioxygenase [Pedobacter cryoconitis]|uniref:Catechol-2,3-dioxygenase n=1 Tax=Pedobacter cryoconitis TaxID=188932 RepID=A0A7W8YR95_9SPHI|nr:VOC family protein [Pedobacter cryoconitis]MBB5620339.1 catechol-2,3-dioxygenase [Pedobacter cryoconitis]MBB5647149.1 catechol-2,3-dioxygenase [Pedobacter cryoconitis]
MKIEAIELLSNNIIETEQFYNNVLNIKTNSKNENEVSFLIGTTKVSFQTSTVERPNYHLAFDIPNNKLEEAFKWLEQRTTVLPVTDDSQFSSFEAWNAKSFYFYDNNGNLLELICRFDTDHQSDVAFDSNSILYVSEIGIVTSDVHSTAEELISQYGLDYYVKQPKTENFAVIGDENGLLILVTPDRNWFPTTKKAQAFEAKVQLSTADRAYQELFIK